MKNKNVRGILALIIVTALSFGVIAGSRALAKEQGTDQSQGQAQVTEELDVSGAENIQSAAKTQEGYLVTVKEAGYGGDIVMEVSFGEDKSTVTGVQVTALDKTFSASALPYSTMDIYNASHDCDLKASGAVYLNLDVAVLGLGNSSCGPGVLKKYAIEKKAHTLNVRISPYKRK